MAGPLQDNPPTANIHITNGASDWLWAVCALMTVSMLFTLFWSHMVWLFIYTMLTDVDQSFITATVGAEGIPSHGNCNSVCVCRGVFRKPLF